MKQILILAIALLIFSSCEKTIELKIEDKGRKMVINSIIAADSNFLVQINESKYILDENYVYTPLTDVSIKLFEDDIEIELIDGSFTELYFFQSIARPGKKYKIEATSSKFGTAWSENTIPQKTIIKDIDFSINTNIHTDYGWTDGIDFKLSFTDMPNVKNYYLLKAYYYSTYYHSINGEEFIDRYLQDAYLKTFDPSAYVAEYYPANGLLYSDDLFDGKEHTFSFYTENINFGITADSENTTYYIVLQTLSEAMYNYYVSYSKYQQTADNPFAEPVKVYTNIKNGFGIFAGFNTCVDSIKIDPALLKKK